MMPKMTSLVPRLLPVQFFNAMRYAQKNGRAGLVPGRRNHVSVITHAQPLCTVKYRTVPETNSNRTNGTNGPILPSDGRCQRFVGVIGSTTGVYNY